MSRFRSSRQAAVFWVWWATIGLAVGVMVWDAWRRPNLPVREKVYTVVMMTAALIVTATFWSWGGIWWPPN